MISQKHFRKRPKTTSETWRKSWKKNQFLKPEMQYFKTNWERGTFVIICFRTIANCLHIFQIRTFLLCNCTAIGELQDSIIFEPLYYFSDQLKKTLWKFKWMNFTLRYDKLRARSESSRYEVFWDRPSIMSLSSGRGARVLWRQYWSLSSKKRDRNASILCFRKQWKNFKTKMTSSKDSSHRKN